MIAVIGLETSELSNSTVKASSEQVATVPGVPTGSGLTVIVTVNGSPKHDPKARVPRGTTV